MKIYKHRSFHQWADLERITDKTLKAAIEEIEKGLYEANLGSGLFKKRIPLSGKGKRGGYRTLIAFKKEKCAFYIYGFAKNEYANINEREEKIYRQLAKDFLHMNDHAITKMIETGKLFEVKL